MAQAPEAFRRPEFQRLRFFVHNPVQRNNGSAGPVAHSPDITDDIVGTQLLRADHTINSLIPKNLGIFRPVDLCNHLGNLQIVGIHGYDQVFLVNICQGHHRVGLVNSLGIQNGAVGTVGKNHRSLGQQLRQLPAPFLLDFNQLHIHALIEQSHRQVNRDPAAADDHNIFDLFLVQMQAADQSGQVSGGGGDIQLVPGLQAEAAVRNHHIISPFHCTHQHLDLHRVVKL